MPNFIPDYLELLQHQVADEIEFLLRHGHDKTVISDPCCFCYKHKDGQYRCNRVNELRQFQSSIAVTRTNEINRDRRKIGYECKENLPEFFPELSKKELPQLLQPL